MTTTSTRKILVLHGYAQNASIFSKRLGALRKQCKSVEMIFLDAPHILQAADLFGDTPESLDSASDPALTPRGWWKFADSSKTTYVGLEATLDLLRDTLKATRFDGVLGFSQGASLATLLTALLERPHLHPSFLVNGQSPHPPFQFCVSVAGFKSRDPISESILSPGFSTPTLHIVGKTDAIVTAERSQTILDVTLNKRVEEHEGGHFVPSKANWRKFLSTYLTEGPTTDIPSPSAMPVSTPSSGTATPTTEVQGVVTPTNPPV